eukprot:Gb_20670 [translate_table: standard]
MEVPKRTKVWLPSPSHSRVLHSPQVIKAPIPWSYVIKGSRKNRIFCRTLPQYKRVDASASLSNTIKAALVHPGALLCLAKRGETIQGDGTGTKYERMAFWDLLFVAFMPVLKVLLISGLGAFLATQYMDVLTADARKHLNKIVFVVFTPSLMFASLAQSVTFGDLISCVSWVCAANAAVRPSSDVTNLDNTRISTISMCFCLACSRGVPGSSKPYTGWQSLLSKFSTNSRSDVLIKGLFYTSMLSVAIIATGNGVLRECKLGGGSCESSFQKMSRPHGHKPSYRWMSQKTWEPWKRNDSNRFYCKFCGRLVSIHSKNYWLWAATWSRGYLGALEGISFLVVFGLIGWSVYTKVKTGSDLPRGPFGLLGAVEALSYFNLLAILVVFGLQYLDYEYVPGPTAGGGLGILHRLPAILFDVQAVLMNEAAVFPFNMLLFAMRSLLYSLLLCWASQHLFKFWFTFGTVLSHNRVCETKPRMKLLGSKSNVWKRLEQALRWFMPINVFLTFLFGASLGWIIVKITKPPEYLKAIVIANCSAGNLGNLIIIIVPALCQERGSPFGEPSVCNAYGIAYASFSMALGAIFIWTFIYSLVRSASQVKKENELEGGIDEKVPNNDYLNAGERSNLLQAVQINPEVPGSGGDNVSNGQSACSIVTVSSASKDCNQEVGKVV